MTLPKIARAAFTLALLASLTACVHMHRHHDGANKCCGTGGECCATKCEKSGGAADAKCGHCGKAACDGCAAKASGCPMSGGASGGASSCCKK